MTTRRWRDPRDGRSWEVSVSRVGRLAEPSLERPAPVTPSPTPSSPSDAPVVATVSFDLLTTPKRGFSAACCERAEDLVPRMADQEMALCLEAARRGGRVWVDPRDGELWWVQGYGRVSRKGPVPSRPLPVVFQSVRSAVGVRSEHGRWVTELTDTDLATLLDAGEPL